MAAAVNQKQNDNQPDEKQRERTGWRAKEVEEASRTHCGMGVGSTSFASGKADSGELSRRVSTKVKSFLSERSFRLADPPLTTTYPRVDSCGGIALTKSVSDGVKTRSPTRTWSCSGEWSSGLSLRFVIRI